MPALSRVTKRRRSDTPFTLAKRGKKTTAKRTFTRKKVTTRKPQKKHVEVTAWNTMNMSPFSTKAGPTFYPSSLFRGSRTPMMLESSHVPVIRTTTGSTVTSSETGNACFVVSPTLTSSFYSESGTALTSTDASLTTTSEHPEYTSYSSLSTEGARYRIIGLSVKLTYIGSQLNRQGQIAVLYSPVVGSGVPSDYSQWENAHHSSSFHSAHKDVIAISRLYSQPDFTTMGSTENSFHMNSIAIALQGVPGSSFKVTTRMFIELIPRADSTLADQSRPATYTGASPPLPTNSTYTMEITV